MSEFQKITAITPSSPSRVNVLLEEIKGDTALMNELSVLGIKDEEIPFYVTLLINYIDSKKACQNCQGLKACQADVPYMCRHLLISSSGRLISELSPCPLYSKEINKETHFLYRDFSSDWSSLSFKVLAKKERYKEAKMALVTAIKKGSLRPWCYFVGENGSGKSYLLASLANDLATQNKNVAFIDTNKRFDELKEYSIKNKALYEKMMSVLTNVEYLFLDGFGDEFKSDYVRDQILLPLLSARSKGRLCTFFSSVYHLSEIERLYSKRAGDYIVSKRLASLISSNAGKEVVLSVPLERFF